MLKSNTPDHYVPQDLPLEVLLQETLFPFPHRVLFPSVVKMKLLLALSVVFIALSVLAEPSSAEPQESSLADRFRSFGESIKGAFKQVGDKAKETVEKLHESDFGKKTREIFSDSVKKIKDTFSK